MSGEEVVRPVPQRYRQRDVSFWAMVALACAGTAMVLANIGPALPASLLAGLHSARTQGGTVVSLQAGMREMEREITKLRRENHRMVALLTLADQGRSQITRRVGALEASIPNLLEAIPADVTIDRSFTTASIGSGNKQTKQVEGGTISYSVEPLLFQPPQSTELPAALAPVEPEPAPVTATVPPDLPRVTTDDYGIAIGKPVSLQDAFVTWSDLRSKVGALLLGLEPVLTSEGADRYKLVAGPITEVSTAETLCQHIARSGTSCISVPYAGYAMPQ